MAGESWPKALLGELCDPARGITYGIVKVGDFIPGGVPVVRGGDIRGGRIVCDDSKRVTEGVSNQFQRTILKGGEIVLNLIADPGHSAIVPVELAGHNVSRDVAVIPLNGSTDVRFVDFFLKSKIAVDWLTARLQGSVTAKINLGTLRELPVPLPPLPEQKAIAAVLGALDDKIELNRRMNATLEAMARALFQSWFVDFDPVRSKLDGRQPVGLDPVTAALFPEHFQDSEAGHIPVDWRVGQVRDLATLNRRAVNPGDFPTEPFDHFSLPAYDNGRTPKAELGSAIMSNKFVVSRDSVLLSKLNPHIPRIWLPDLHATRRSVCSTEFIVASTRPGYSREFLFSLFTSGAFASTYGTLVTGTTGSHQRIRPESVLDMKIVIPPPPLVDAFAVLAKPMFDQINRNIDQSRTLAILRDTLLPKLLRGDLIIESKE